MPAFLLGALGLGKTIGEAIARWLSRRSLAEIVAIAVALALIVDHLALLASHRHAAKVEAQLKASTQALNTSRENEAKLRGEIALQSKAIADLSAKSEAQQKEAAKAENQAIQRADAAEGVSDRLRASARSSAGKSTAACEPSAALKEQWP